MSARPSSALSATTPSVANTARAISKQQIAERVAAAANFAPHITERQRPNGKRSAAARRAAADKGFVTLYSDVTEQRYIENLTEHQNIQLDERVRRRTAQLENANANLTRANSENSRIAAALRRSEERLRLINDTIPILIGYVDHNEVYQYANKGYSDWYGHPEGSVTGRGVRDVIGDHVYGQVRENVRKALSGQQVTYEYQMQRQRPDRLRAQHAGSGNLARRRHAWLSSFFPTRSTEQKRMQAALVQAQKMEAIGQLTGGLAHDFNNLLTVVIGNLAALQDHRPDDAEVNEFVEPALQSARRGVQLIKRLLTFSRQQPLEPQAVDIGRLIGGLSKLVRRSLPESIAVSTDLASASIHAWSTPANWKAPCSTLP
jgi:PAS domain S-box-containing protein